MLTGGSRAVPVDVHARNKYGMTALHMAVVREKRSAVLLLMRAGSDPNLRNFAGRSAFDLAKDRGMRDLLHALFHEQALALRGVYDDDELDGDAKRAGAHVSDATANFMRRMRGEPEVVEDMSHTDTASQENGEDPAAGAAYDEDAYDAAGEDEYDDADWYDA